MKLTSNYISLTCFNKFKKFIKIFKFNLFNVEAIKTKTCLENTKFK